MTAPVGGSTDDGPLREIAALRSQLDALNFCLLELLEARGRLVIEVMAIKRSLGRSPHDPQREREMVDAVLSRADGVYPPAAIERIFRVILDASRAIGQ